MQVERSSLLLSGERVSNAWITCLLVWDNHRKLWLIPDMTPLTTVYEVKDLSPLDGSKSHQVVGRVMAYQAYDA